MKICMFTNTYLPHVGGVARSVSSFVAGLRALGHQVLVVAPTFPGVESGEDRQQGIYRVPAIQNFNGSDFSVRLPLPTHLAEAITEFAPDIIHSHHPFLLGDTALRYARARNLPLVFTHHTLYENYTHYVPLDSDALKRFVIHLSTEYANLCCGVIAPSRSVAELLKQRGVRQEIAEIPTGVDLELFASGNAERFRKKMGLAPDELLIGHIGRLAEEKNLLYLAGAAAIFLRNHPAARFFIAGKGEATEKIKAIFELADVAVQVRYAGDLEPQDLADAYQAMDIFIFASKSETQGLVLAEAMAAATPVVSLDASGVREVVVDRENGRLLPADATAAQFAAALAELSTDRNRLRDLARAALHTAQRYSRVRAVAALAALYEKIIRRHGNKPAEHHIGPLEELQLAVRTEWELLTEKLHAMVQSL